jgi:ABC-type sugar transport system permease subunit
MDQPVKGKKSNVDVKPATPHKQGKKHKVLSLQKQKAKMGWLFIAPFLIGFVIIYLPMIAESIYFSFCKMKTGSSGYTLEFIGLENYKYAILTDADFTGKLGQSVLDLLFQIPAIVIFSLFIAVLLNEKMKGRAAFRAIFFIPVIVSTGIIESIDIQNAIAQAQMNISDISQGNMSASNTTSIISNLDVQRYLQGMIVGQDLVTYITDLVNGIYDIVNKSGVQMLIYLAGLQSISPSIYESCQIDGATSWETFWKITFPMISPMILVNTVYTVIDSFTSKSNVVMNYIADVYSKNNEGMMRATAMSWMYFLVVILILLVVGGLVSAYVFYQRRDS